MSGGVPLYISTIDFTKAFDRIKHSALWSSLCHRCDEKDKDVPTKVTRTLQLVTLTKVKPKEDRARAERVWRDSSSRSESSPGVSLAR